VARGKVLIAGELFNKSPNLRQYVEFIEKLREFIKQYGDYSQAARETVSHCMSNGILTEFLKEQEGKIDELLSGY
jgi:hypothetical protein